MKRYLMSTALAAALFVPGAAVAQTATTAPATQQMAADFVQMASFSNRFEIESSQLALARAQSAGVRNFAQQMVQDHMAAGEFMMQAVQASGMDVAVPAGLDPRHRQMVAQLQGLTVNELDEAYLQMQRQAHDKAVALFAGYAQNGEAGPLREFAASTLPVLQEHRQMLMAGMDGMVIGATDMAPNTAAGVMPYDPSGATTAVSGEGGANAAGMTKPFGGVVPGQSLD